MNKRATVIIGAGAILDFDFADLVVPSTSNITDIVSKLTVRGLNSEESNIIRTIYCELKNKINEIPLRRGLSLPRFQHQINFEELFFVIEQLCAINGISKKENLIPSASPLWGYLVEQISSIQYPTIEYYQAQCAIIDKIMNIILDYDSKFNDNADYEKWYRLFWMGRPSQWDIFTFNYDTTVESSLGSFEDGFEDAKDDKMEYERFNPNKLYKNASRVSTLHHLHGCINYSELNPSQFAFVHSHRDMYKLHNSKDYQVQFCVQSPPNNQAYEQFVNSPIIIGQRKLDKLIYLPFSIYHANMVNKIIENPNLLIIGYSFGDLYANQLIERHKLIHGDNQRVVLIDKLPGYITNSRELYRHIENCLSGGLKLFLRRQFDYKITADFKINGLNIKDYTSPIYSDDGHTIMFINGFKNSISLHKDLIYSTLRI